MTLYDDDSHGWAAVPAKPSRPQPRTVQETKKSVSSKKVVGRQKDPLTPAQKKALEDLSGKIDRRMWGKDWEKIQIKAGANRPYDVAELPENQPKNRYYDVLPFDYNRVLLHPKDYINASLVKAKDEEVYDGNAWHFIAAQGPLQETAADFWRMVMEQYTKQIVMLTRTEEVNTKGQAVEKCYCYFPLRIGDSQLHGSLKIELMNVTRPNADLVIRRFKMTNAQIHDTWEVEQFQFINWPDQGAIEKGNGTLLDLIGRLEATGAVEMAKKEPPIIHCNTGLA